MDKKQSLLKRTIIFVVVLILFFGNYLPPIAVGIENGLDEMECKTYDSVIGAKYLMALAFQKGIVLNVYLARHKTVS